MQMCVITDKGVQRFKRPAKNVLLCLGVVQLTYDNAIINDTIKYFKMRGARRHNDIDRFF